MKSHKLMVAIVVGITSIGTCFAAELTSAVFKENQAVSKDMNGHRKVELPSSLITKNKNPSYRFVKPDTSRPLQPGSNEFKDIKVLPPLAKPLYMIERADGLVECSVLTVEDQACRPSTIGSVLWQRIWIVKVHADWLSCVKMTNLKFVTHGDSYKCQQLFNNGSVIPEIQKLVGLPEPSLRDFSLE